MQVTRVHAKVFLFLLYKGAVHESLLREAVSSYRAASSALTLALALALATGA